MLLLVAALSSTAYSQYYIHDGVSGRAKYNFVREKVQEYVEQGYYKYEKVDFILTGDDAIDELMLDAVKQAWDDVADIGSVTIEEYEKFKESNKRHFIGFMTETTTINYVKNSKLKLYLLFDGTEIDNINMADLEYLPLETRFLLAVRMLRAEIDFDADFYTAGHRDVTDARVQEWRKRMKEVPSKPLYIDQNYLGEGVTMEGIKEVYQGEFFLVNHDELMEIIEEKRDCFVLIGGKTPSKDEQVVIFTPHQYETKLIINPSNSLVYQVWMDIQKISKFGMSLKDFKRISAGKEWK